MRAKGRSIHAAQKLSSVDEDERVGPGPTDKLWEVPCKASLQGLFLDWR